MSTPHAPRALLVTGFVVLLVTVLAVLLLIGAVEL
ncbi:hypothetical protein HNR19_000558 [Nocardioides thalensis]|uniref:Uncharacterized protein n=1 Tax=Nocardioides thalensis TaxID=1914755 RepID=A0A853BVH1_9ACTN|nr:hypothetical protein [Nocardioides thalensis]